MALYYYTKENVNITTLVCEIKLDTVISAALDYAYFDSPDQLQIYFFDELSFEEQTELDELVDSHSGDLLTKNDFIACYGTPSEVYYDDQETEPAIDPTTGISGSFWMMEILRMSRDLYNNIDNLLYVDGYKTIYGPGGYIEDLEAKPNTLLELLDTPSNYDDGKYLKSTISGAVWDNPIGVFGNNYHGNFDEDLSSTTSTDWQQKLRLSVTNLQSGNYHIAWFYEWAYANGNFNFKCRVQIDDDIILSEQTTRPPVGNTSYYMSSSGFSINYLSGGHYIDLDYCSSRSGRTACIRSTRIVLWRVS